MASRFFYIWRGFGLFSLTSTLIFYSSFAFSAYSISHTFSLSDFDFDGSSFDSSPFITSTLVSETKDLLPSSGGLSGLSHELNFKDHVCHEAFEAIDYSFSNIKNGSITIESCYFDAVAENTSFLELAFSFTPKSGGTVSAFAFLKPNTYSSCVVLSPSDIQQNAGTLNESGNPVLIPNDSYIFLDYPNFTHNIDHSCFLVLNTLPSLNQITTDPPVDMSINKNGCFDVSQADLTGKLFPYQLLFNWYGSNLPSSIIKNMPVDISCATNQSDRDSDGVPDSVDKCPVSGVLVNGSVGENGCPVYQDSDNDGIPEHDGEGNSPDKCPNSAPSDAVSSDGCLNSPLPEPDSYYIPVYSGHIFQPFDYTQLTKGIPPSYANPEIITVSTSVHKFQSISDYLNSFGVFNFQVASQPPVYLIKNINQQHQPPLNSPFLINLSTNGKFIRLNGEYENRVARISSDSFENYFSRDFSKSQFDSFIRSAFEITDLQSGFILEGSLREFYDPFICKNASFPTDTYYFGNENYGSTFYISGVPTQTKQDYARMSLDYIINHTVLDESGNSVGSIPLQNPSTKRPILRNSLCESDVKLMQCYNNNNSIISESGYVTCKNDSTDSEGNDDFSKIPKYVPSGVPAPLFSDMLGNNQTLSDLESRSFGFGSTSPPCPVYNFDFNALGLGVQTVNYHCQLINQFRLPLDAMFYGLWSFIAVRVFLSA